MNITGEVDISKIKLSKPFHSFKLEYGKAILVNMLRNWYWWLLFILSIAGIMIFDFVYVRVGGDHDAVMLTLRTSILLIVVPMTAAFFLSFRGRLSIPYGEAVAYSCGQNEIAIVSKGRYDFERIVAIKVNKIKKFHGYYCLIENYFKYVFVPLDFPIDKINKPIDEKEIEQTIE